MCVLIYLRTNNNTQKMRMHAQKLPEYLITVFIEYIYMDVICANMICANKCQGMQV